VAEAPEHRFLTDTTLDLLSRMSESRLYGYREADRRTYDFACNLIRDGARGVVGQTLWKHVEGVDKDVRTLLADDEADVCLYVAQDTTRARNIYYEATDSYRRAYSGSSPWRLRVIWIPADFNADQSDDRSAITNLLEDYLTRDVLLNVVLGNLSGENLGLFICSTGRIGLDLVILHQIAFSGFLNLRNLANAVETSPASLRERLVRLQGCGFVAQPDPAGSFYFATVRGRVFLELCRELWRSGPTPVPELRRIMEILGIAPDTDSGSVDHGARTQARYEALMFRINVAVSESSVDLTRTDYYSYWEDEAWPPTIPRPVGPT
jgi:hypothetical protein